MLHCCPNCGSRSVTTFLSEETIRRETILRARFVAQRLRKMPCRAERMDSIDFAHGSPASLLQCSACDLLIRAEAGKSEIDRYTEDEYDAGVMERLLPRYVEAFRQKETPYRALLREGAEVLEIGSHLGAFLKVAEEWGWKAQGIDVGRDAVEFAASQGLAVNRATLHEAAFPPERFDAVFVWNCFEQIEEPHSILNDVKHVLKPGGLLLLRTPNALFYRVCERFLAACPDSDQATWVTRALGYNNLLAFPYLYGYSGKTLIEIAGRHGYRCEGKLNAELITLTYPVLFDWVVEEVQATRAALLDWSELADFKNAGESTGPWIEVFYRSV